MSCTGSSGKMWMSPVRIRTPVLTSQKTDGLFTMIDMIPYHAEHNHHTTANSHTVHRVWACLMCLIGTRQKIGWAGKSRWTLALNSSLKSPQRQDCIHLLIGAIRRCGCFQLHLKIYSIVWWWRCAVPRHSTPQCRVRCIPSGLITIKVKKMRHTVWSKLYCLGQGTTSWNRNSQMGNESFRFRSRMLNWLILNGLRKGNQNWKPMWKDTLWKVLQENASAK